MYSNLLYPEWRTIIAQKAAKNEVAVADHGSEKLSTIISVFNFKFVRIISARFPANVLNLSWKTPVHPKTVVHL